MSWLYENTDKKQFINLFNRMFVKHRRVHSFHKEDEEVIAIDLTPIKYTRSGFIVTDNRGVERPVELNSLASIPTANINLIELRSAVDAMYDKYFCSDMINVGDGFVKSLSKSVDKLEEVCNELKTKNEYINHLEEQIKTLSEQVETLTHPGYSEQVIAAKRKEITDFVKSKFL